MNRLLSICILTVFFVSFTPQTLAEGKVINIAATEWNPYMSEQLPGKGVIPEITRMAFERAGYKTVFTFYPWKRLLGLTQDGVVDAAIGVSHTDERLAYFLYPTQTTFEDRKVIFFTKGEQVRKEFSGNLHDLCPDRVGVLSGSYLEKLLQDVGCISVDSANSVDLNFAKLLRGRYKYLLESHVSIMRLLSSTELSDNERKNISYYETPVDIDKNYTVFSKKAVQQKPYLRTALKAFDESLAEMKSDGTYEEVLRAHGM